jgi:DNA-binding CsgD family transcriptional regulator
LRQGRSSALAGVTGTFTLIAKGMRNKEIAIALDVTEHTARMHVKNLLGKPRLNDRAGAIAVAFKRGFIHLE